jgi:hypothetical protein
MHDLDVAVFSYVTNHARRLTYHNPVVRSYSGTFRHRCCALQFLSPSRAEQTKLYAFRRSLIGLAIGEKMAIGVKSHLDRRMTHEGLYLLGVVPLFDPQRSAGVAQGVQTLFGDGHQHRQAGIIHGLSLDGYGGSNLDRSETAVDQIGVALDLADAVRENQPKVTLGAEQFPLSQRV